VKLTFIHDHPTWNNLVAGLPGGHLLQSWEWGQLKEKFGWQADHLIWSEEKTIPLAAAQVLRRGFPLPGIRDRITILYCPRGPAMDWADQRLRSTVLNDLSNLASQRGAISLKIDPDLPLGYGLPDDPDGEDAPVGQSVVRELLASGWRASTEQIQFRNTLTIDLSLSEEDLLAGMKQKTRYNIRLARRNGVDVRHGGLEDLDLLYQMYAETSIRDKFVIRKPAYYHDAWGSFISDGLAQPLIAMVGDEPVAALIVYHFGDTTTYMYGMSRSIHRKKMPNHLLQWEAIRWAKIRGCTTYDFWGAPDELDPKDPMWGVYRFKQGFGARIVRTIGAWDRPTRPLLYFLYNIVKPNLMTLFRLRGHSQTRRQLEDV
jgi:lipid II:glycine glycyltransferase (peptidoglycan interpeptide bridge formation enzyme)